MAYRFNGVECDTFEELQRLQGSARTTSAVVKETRVPVANANPILLYSKHPGKAGIKCYHPDAQGVHINCNDCNDDGLTLRDYSVMRADS
mgnify:CR=1 FL=1